MTFGSYAFGILHAGKVPKCGLLVLRHIQSPFPIYWSSSHEHPVSRVTVHLVQCWGGKA
jgi:hypothetical protein